MIGHRVVSLVVVGVVTATVLASGPFVPVDFTSYDRPCEGGALSSQGSATIEPASIPESATLTRSAFGAEVWKLDAPDAELRASDVRGCVRLSYELSIDALGISSMSTTTVSDDSPERHRLSIPKTTLQPDRVSEDRYDAEVRLVYHGVENGTAVERAVVDRPITVEVTE